MSPEATDAAPAPFTMIGGVGVVCEGDVCVVPDAGDPVAVREVAQIDASDRA